MTESETYGKKDEDDGTHSQLSTERLQMSMDRPQGSPVDCFDERASLLEKTTPTSFVIESKSEYCDVSSKCSAFMQSVEAVKALVEACQKMAPNLGA